MLVWCDTQCGRPSWMVRWPAVGPDLWARAHGGADWWQNMVGGWESSPVHGVLHSALYNKTCLRKVKYYIHFRHVTSGHILKKIDSNWFLPWIGYSTWRSCLYQRWHFSTSTWIVHYGEPCPYLMNWIGLHLFNDNTHPSGHISRRLQVGFSHSCLCSRNEFQWWCSVVGINSTWECCQLVTDLNKELYWIYGHSYQIIESGFSQKFYYASFRDRLKEGPQWVNWIGLDWICLTTTHVLQVILAVLHK